MTMRGITETHDGQNNPDFLLQCVMYEAKKLKIPVSPDIDSHVRINTRAVGRFGLCRRCGDKYTIEISDRLLTAPEMSCRQTLAHEILHTCPGCINHQAAWKSYAAAMNAAYGYNIKRTDDCESLGIEQTPAIKYTLHCDKCGAVIARRRKSTVIAHPERYRCKCGGRLIAD